jgi:hypothetical protein
VEVSIDNVTVTFSEVTAGGQTTVATIPNPIDPPPPAGFALGDPPVYYEIDTQNVVFMPPVTVCIDYTGTAFDNEALVQLRHFEAPNWVDVTDTRDTVNNIVCGDVQSLSPFAVFEPIPPTPTPTVSPSPTPKPQFKIKLCHKRKNTIEVGSLRALIAHLRHGDRLGPCKKKRKHDDNQRGRSLDGRLNGWSGGDDHHGARGWRDD